MADNKAKSPKTPWYLTGIELTEHGLAALFGGLGDIRTEVAKTFGATIEYVGSGSNRGAALAQRLVDRVDGLAQTALGSTESALAALFAAARKSGRNAADAAVTSVNDLAA